MNKTVFYHAGCPVCISAEQMVVDAFNPEKYQVEIVHLAEHPDRIKEAEAFGVKSVPALVMNDHTFHINYGASIDDLKH